MMKAFELKAKQYKAQVEKEVAFLNLPDVEVTRKVSSDKKELSVGIYAFHNGDNFEASYVVKVSGSGKAMGLYMVTDEDGPQLVYRGNLSVTAYSTFGDAILQECLTYIMEVTA